MTDTSITQIGLRTLTLAGLLSAPILLTTLALGLLIGIFQSATQLQEPTLAFVPKLLGVGVVLLVSGNWMLSEAITFTHQLFDMIPKLLG
jgi:flagellar biosynthetic protein FliQ